jgi:monofunctional biosynthetic peptidoglycan transglycosylase
LVIAARLYGKVVAGQAPIGVAHCAPRRYAKGMETGKAVSTEPIVEPDLAAPGPEAPDMARIRRILRQGGRRPWVRRLVKAAIVVALAPFVLTILYLPSFVHPISTLMIGDLVTFQGYDRRWVPIEDIAPVMQHSVIMSEDGQFCAHYGVDLAELKGVVMDTLAGETARGASTIPMQTVKNLYLFNVRSFLRKVVELPIAIFYDLFTPKRRILETYLNIAEWGPNIYGIEAAAQHYFGVSAKNLSRRQAALLTVALPNPAMRNPAKPGPGLRRLARLIERRASMAGGHVSCLK